MMVRGIKFRKNDTGVGSPPNTTDSRYNIGTLSQDTTCGTYAKGDIHPNVAPKMSHNSKLFTHYYDVIMGTKASQTTSLAIVYSTVYSGADQRKYQSSASLAFVRGIHRWPVNSPHKWPVMRKMFPFDDVIIRVRKLYLLSRNVNTYNISSHFKWALVAGKSMHMVKYKIHIIKSIHCLLMYASIRTIWMPLVSFWWHDILGNFTIFHKSSPFGEPLRNIGVIAIEYLVVINIYFISWMCMTRWSIQLQKSMRLYIVTEITINVIPTKAVKFRIIYCESYFNLKSCSRFL